MVSNDFRKTCSGLLALYFVGFGLFLAAFSSDHWKTNGPINSGLWRSCFRRMTDSTFTCDRLEIGDYPDWMKAVVVLMILSLVFGVVSGVTYMFVPLSGSLQLVTGALTLISVIVYGGYQSRNGIIVTSDLGWSFYVAVVSSACFIVNGITLLVLLSEEEDGFTMEKILPKDKTVKVGSSERYPTHIY